MIMTTRAAQRHPKESLRGNPYIVVEDIIDMLGSICRLIVPLHETVITRGNERISRHLVHLIPC